MILKTSVTELVHSLYPETVIETIPFLIIIFLELSGSNITNEWERIYREYKNEDDIETGIPDKRKKAVRTSLENYVRYSFDYTQTKQYLFITGILALFVVLGRWTQEPIRSSWVGVMALASVAPFLVYWYVMGWLNDQSPHKYDELPPRIPMTIGELSVLASNVFVIIIILLTDIFL